MVRDGVCPCALTLTGSGARRKGGKVSFLCLLQVGFTSAPGQGGILAQRDFDRRFSPHFVSACPLIMEKSPGQLQPSAVASCSYMVCVACFGEFQLELEFLPVSSPEHCHRSS